MTQECQRVLGSLMEKEMVTPDAYPLSINAVMMASNQRSSREPVMDLDEDRVRTALDTLEALELVAVARDLGRVVKFEHRIRTVLTLRRDETAVLCLLLLRGPQTPGELRSRSDRMFQFDDLAQLQGTLDRLAARPEPLVVQLARQPGAREARWSHLLGGAVAEPAAKPQTTTEDVAAMDALRGQVAALEARVAALEARLAEGSAGAGQR